MKFKLKQNDKDTLKWLHNNSKQIYFALIILTLLGALIAYIGVQLALFSKTLLDTAQLKGAGPQLVENIIKLLIIVMTQLAFQSVYTVLNVKVSCHYSMDLKEKIFNFLLKKDLQNVTKFHTGELLNRINNDVSVIVNGVVNLIPNLVSLVCRVVFCFFALFTLDPQFALTCLIVAPFIFILTRMYSKKMKTLHKKCMETDGKTRSYMMECLQNLLVIKTYNNEEKVTKKSREYQQDNFNVNMKRNYINIIVNILFYLGITVFYYGALAYCAYKVAAGIMTFGTLTAIVQLVGQVQVPFKEIASCIPQYFSTIASTERIIELNNLKNEDKTEFLTINNVEDNSNIIEIKNLSFSYDNNEMIFEDTAFSMKRGEFIAIGGISGIGKSTLLKIILSILKPDKGEIKLYIQNKNDNFAAYVPQGNMILSGTIKENIAFYSEIDEDKIIETTKNAEIYDFISELPNGFDTMLGEKGLGISEGQIQRIAIARALYFDTDLLILDEATSALDLKTEIKVLENIKKIKGKSCIIISHKKAAFEVCDKIIKIENKKIISA